MRSVVAVVFAATFGGRFVAVPAEVDRAVRLFGDALAGAVFLSARCWLAAARLGRAVLAFACGFADLAGAVVAFFFGDLAGAFFAAGPVAFAGLAGGRRCLCRQSWLQGFGTMSPTLSSSLAWSGRAAFAADVLVVVAVFAVRGVPGRDARPPRPAAAMATPLLGKARRASSALSRR